jgi:cytochrome c peroxidase
MLTFYKSFGSSTINSNTISKALSQFVRSLFPINQNMTREDKRYQQLLHLRQMQYFQILQHRKIVVKKFSFTYWWLCTCHGSETFTAPEAKNNGLDATVTDRGFGTVTSNAADDGLFKVTSLRNVELTAPYMHDGRFTTLGTVVEHYNSGVKNHPNLSPQLKCLMVSQGY